MDMGFGGRVIVSNLPLRNRKRETKEGQISLETEGYE